MCGIVGYVSLKDDTRKYSKEKFLTEGLYVNALRGFDSTGVMGVSDDMTWEYSKQAVPAARFVGAGDWEKRNFEQWATVGHNRAATVGAVDTDNSHPFHHGNILLVHNGTLRSTYDLPFKNPDIDVDSSLIAYNLNQVEPGEAVDKVIKNLQGAYALVWFDLRDESINFVRNTERPLHFGLNKQADILYFMSEGHMLNMITKRFADYSSRPTNIWQLGVRQMLKYKKGSLMPEVKEVPNFTNGRRGWEGYYNQTNNYVRPQSQVPAQTRSGRRHGDSAECPLGGSKGVKIRINGEYKIPPKPLREMVTEWYSLKLTEQLYFRPGGWLPWSEGGEEDSESAMGAMYGLIFHPEWDCWIEAVVPYIRESQARVCKQSNGWTVSPYAIDHTTVDETSKHGFTIMCRAKWFSWDGQPPFPTDASDTVKKLTSDEEKQGKESDNKMALHDWEQQIDADDIDEDTPSEMVKGPRGTYIKDDEWEALTNDGCVMCTGPVYLEDAEEMLWVGEHENQPLCMGCFEWASTPEGDRNES